MNELNFVRQLEHDEGVASGASASASRRRARAGCWTLHGGWENECFPCLETGGLWQPGSFVPSGRGRVGRDPGGREAVQADPRQGPQEQ